MEDLINEINGIPAFAEANNLTPNEKSILEALAAGHSLSIHFKPQDIKFIHRNLENAISFNTGRLLFLQKSFRKHLRDFPAMTRANHMDRFLSFFRQAVEALTLNK